MTLTDLQNALAGTGIGDVLIAGFVDRNNDGRVQFWPTYYTYFLECGAVLLKFSADPDTGRMRISRVDAVRDDLDPDLEPAWASVGTAVLENSIGSTALRALRLWGVDETPEGLNVTLRSSILRMDRPSFWIQHTILAFDSAAIDSTVFGLKTFRATSRNPSTSTCLKVIDEGSVPGNQ